MDASSQTYFDSGGFQSILSHKCFWDYSLKALCQFYHESRSSLALLVEFEIWEEKGGTRMRTSFNIIASLQKAVMKFFAQSYDKHCCRCLLWNNQCGLHRITPDPDRVQSDLRLSIFIHNFSWPVCISLGQSLLFS